MLSQPELAKILLDTFLWIKMENFLSTMTYPAGICDFISGFDMENAF